MGKRHNCNRCGRHGFVVEVQKKTGAYKSMCERCLDILVRKGAPPPITRPSSDVRQRERNA